jgi:hypothetical protein
MGTDSTTFTRPLAGTPARILSWRKRLLFTLISLTLTVMLAELTLQIFYRSANGDWLWNWWAIPIFESDPVRLFRVKSNLHFVHKTSEFSVVYLTDDAGMRTDGRQPTPVIPKPADRFRILALGPSFAFGWGVNYEDAYLHQIAEGLKIPGKQLELVNLGTPSQPICCQLKWLRETGYVYQPDLIIQTVYGDVEQLDIDATLPSSRPSVRNGYLYPSEKMTLSMYIRSWRRYSAILFYGWHVYQAFAHAENTVGDGREFYNKADLAIDGANVLKRYESYLSFVEASLTNKTPVVFIHIPAAWVVHPSDLIRVAHHGEALNPIATRQHIAQFIDVLQSNQVDIIDTTSALVQHDNEGRMYNLYDVHFTRAGNKVVADHALPVIQKVVHNALKE